jgi:peptidoglycan hydrolase-like protein with peptidoglycan-binding domain
VKRRSVVVGLVGVVVLVGAAGAAAAGLGGDDSGTADQGAPVPATATITKATLTQTEDVDGTLGYGDATAVGGRLGGTVTGLAAVGSIVDRGKALYYVDNAPVVLMNGTLPLYRPLRSGVSGADVRQFEQNLAALGYTGFTADDEFTGSTASAVRSWQEKLGLPETGAVEIGRVVFAPGPVRVSEHKANIGDQAGGAILSYTGTTRIVTVDLDVARQDLVKAGAAATVTLPGGKRVNGTIASVGTVATSSSSGGAGAETTTTIDVVVSLADQASLGTLDQAPVDVTLVANQRKDVLTVPVAALLALAEGGYGLEVVDGSTTRIVAVQAGMFANGRVEVSGGGIAEGMTVGVPK